MARASASGTPRVPAIDSGKDLPAKTNVPRHSLRARLNDPSIGFLAFGRKGVHGFAC